MHKRIPVLEMELDDETGSVIQIGTLYASDHLPIGIMNKNGAANRQDLNEWWTDRAIPASRSGVRSALETLQIASTKTLLVRCYGLSLSDQYWICPEHSNLCWDEINFFDNDFSADVGDILFGADKRADRLNFSSPDNTSDGNLKKRWKIINGERCLVKGGSNPFRQQPFNEVIATGVLERLQIPHIPYTLAWNKGAPYSVCADFVDENTDLIPAWRVMKLQKKPNHISVYQHFVSCCELLNIPDVVPFLDRMIAVDYIIANEDRHFNNFGVLRNAATLEWIGMAPIYDSGSSLGYDKLPAQIRAEREIVCKPFKNHYAEQLKLISSLDWFSASRLRDVDQLIAQVLTSDGAEAYMDDQRIAAITNAVQRRIDNLEFLKRQGENNHRDSISDDVEQNIAQSY